MGTIIERKRADGSTVFRAQIVIKQNGKIVYQTSRTFDRKVTAGKWMTRKERELKAPGAIEKLTTPTPPTPTLSDAIDKYVDGQIKEIGRTKAQVLRAIKEFEIADREVDQIDSSHVVAFAEELIEDRSSQTVANYLSHLSAVFTLARPAWGIALDPRAMKDAMLVCKRLGLISKSNQRDRRPSLEELNKLLDLFEDRYKRGRSMPMHQICIFALFSTRRQNEIVRPTWGDLDSSRTRILIKDMKHPGEKIGNDVWCELPPEAQAVINGLPDGPLDQPIFPYNSQTISARFTRACKLLGIDDLRFHDLRHEGISRLFEMGWTIPQVATVSGHRSWQSLQRYSHLRQTGDKYAAWRKQKAY